MDIQNRNIGKVTGTLQIIRKDTGKTEEVEFTADVMSAESEEEVEENGSDPLNDSP